MQYKIKSLTPLLNKRHNIRTANIIVTSNDLQITTQKTNHDLATRTLLKTRGELKSTRRFKKKDLKNHGQKKVTLDDMITMSALL